MHLHNTYGYVCNPDKTLTQNFNSLLHSPLNNLPFNSTYHNKCTTIQPPVGTRELLGLNLKFCIASCNFKPNIKISIKRLAYNIRTAFHLKSNGITSASNDNYHPQIYVKLKGWDPPPAPLSIKDNITSFEKTLSEVQRKYQPLIRQRSSLNLNALQLKTLQNLRHNTDFIIKPSDKNLGPVIMNTNDYIKLVLQEHLLTKAYTRLTQSEALQQIEHLQQTLKNLVYANVHLLSTAEKNFFLRSFKAQHRIPIFMDFRKYIKHPSASDP
jgi:hypothetical protein